MSSRFGKKLPCFASMFVALFTAAWPALSDPPQPAIQSAVVNYGVTPNTLTITGTSFGTSALVNIDEFHCSY